MQYQRTMMVGGVACAVLLFFLVGAVGPMARTMRFVMYPFVAYTANLSQRMRSAIGRSQYTEAAWQELEARIAAEGIDRVRFQSLEEENKLLRKQLNFLEKSGHEAVGARIISRDLENGRMHFLLDRGTQDGVERGQGVMTLEGVFVGKILRTRERVSVLEVFTDPDARTIVARAEGQRLLGVIEGRGNGAALLTYVPPSEEIQKDDLLVTAGTEEKVPAQLLVSIINRVNGKPTDPFLTASVEPLVGLERLSFVSILQPKQ